MPVRAPRTGRRGLTAWLAAALVAPLAVAGLALAPAASAAAPTDGLLLHYPLQGDTGTVATDASGNGRHGTLVGTAVETPGEGLAFDGTSTHVKLPNNLMQGLSAITVSADVLVSPQQTGAYFIYGFGNSTSGAGNGYLFTTGNGYRTAISTCNWSCEQSVDQGANLARGVWKTLTYTLGGGTATLYLDGVQVGQRTGVTITPGAIGGGTTTANYLGRSLYSGDALFRGRMKDVRVYGTALSAADVRSLAPDDATFVSRDLAALTLGDLSAVTASTIALPASGLYGSTITWASSAPDVVAADGTVVRPAAGSPDAQVTLTATLTRGDATATKEFTATVVAREADQVVADRIAAGLTVPHLEAVKGNLTLPTEVDGATVAWTSGDAAVLTPTGEVTRPAADVDVPLTATVTYGTATATRELTAHVVAAVQVAPYTGYAFAYFTNNTIAGEKIYMAASRGNNALQWDELNGGQPILASNQGTKGLRDPFIIRSPEGDTFYMIATDLSIGSGTSWDASQRSGSQYLEVWESTDLIHWSDQRHVKVSPDNAGNTWAPEAYYDDTIGAYVVFWASKLYAENDPNHTGGQANRMMYATTRDFVTFTDAQVWNFPGTSVIDSTVIEEDGTYYRFTKDEGSAISGCLDIIQERSTSLRAVDLPGENPRDWQLQVGCIGRNAGTAAVEGPTIFKANPGDVNGQKYYLFVDEFGGRGYIPLESASLTNPSWRVSSSYRLPASPRHGTVLPVTQAELDALRAGPAPSPANAAGELLRYTFDGGSGTTVRDASGNGRDGRVVNNANPLWNAGGYLTLDGTDDYVDLPDNLLAGVTDITVEADVRVSSQQTGSYFLYGFGNTTPAGVGNGYLFATGNATYRAGVATGNWTTEQVVSSGAALQRGVWKHLVYRIQGTTATLWLDGVKVGTQTGVTIDPKDIGVGHTLNNFIGKSAYTADRTLRGDVREFSVFNRALSDREIRGLAGLDITAPAVTTATSPGAPDGADGWFTSPVTVTATATDARDAAPKLETSSDGGATWAPYAPVVVEADGEHAVLVRATDASGNVSDPVTVSLKVDRTAPEVALVGGPEGTVLFGEVPAAPTCEAADATSGLAGCEVTGYSTAVGTHTVTATATDEAGLTATATREYTVAPYTLAGFYAPVDMGVVNTVKAGATVPVQFEVLRGTTELTALGEIRSITVTKVTDVPSAPTDEIETLATGGTGLRYDAEAGRYVYTWKTPSAKGTYRLTVTTVDGSTISTLFKLR